MGFLDRVKDIATGLGGALQAPVGLVVDLARAPFTDDETDGIVNTIFRTTVKRGGQFLGNLVGPDEGLGAVFGAAPEAVRSPVRSVLTPTFNALEDVYREAVAEPLATGLFALQGVPLSEGYRIAQPGGTPGSPGAAFAFLAGGVDPRNEVAVARYMATDRFEVISGVADAVTRVFLDPTVVGGKAARVARSGILVQEIRSATQLERALTKDRLLNFNREVGKIVGESPEGAAARVRHRFFPQHANGAAIADVLASETDDSRRLVALAALMGHRPSLNLLGEERADLLGRVNRLQGELDPLLKHGDDTLFSNPELVTRYQAEIDALVPLEKRTAWLDTHDTALITQVPRVSRSGRLRHDLVRSDWYQTSPFAVPLRVTFNMRPQHLLNFEDAASDVQVWRYLQKSDLPVERQEALRARYMAANSSERQQVWSQIEQETVESIATSAGMTAADLTPAWNAIAAQQRAAKRQVATSRAYSSDPERSVVSVLDGEGVTELNVPLWVTQHQNWAAVANLDHVRDATTTIGKFRADHPNLAIPGQLMDGFMKTWRASVLLRGAWPVRVVMDEQLRIISKVGALVHMDRLLRTAWADMRGIDPYVGTLKIRNYELEQVYGGVGDARNVTSEMAKANSSFRKVAGLEEDRILNELRSATGNFHTIDAAHPDYATSYSRVANLQIGKDEVGRQLLEGRSVTEIVDWLKSSPAGRTYARRNAIRAANKRNWVETQAADLNDLLPTDALKAAALRGKADTRLLAAELGGDSAAWPKVNSEILAEVQGTGPVTRAINKIVGSAFELLGSKPTMMLSRNPFMDEMYRAEATRIVSLLDDQVRKEGRTLTQHDLDMATRAAREYALTQTKSLLYDLAERSELGEILRHVIPFFDAFQEVITRWAGITIENPAFVARLRQVWLSPERAGIVTDENGNIIHSDGTATSPLGTKVKPGSERRITFSLAPGMIGDLLKAVPGTIVENIEFNKESFNLALQGAPGFGPAVQIPVNEIVKDRPELEASLDFVLPFGATQELREMILPATAKRLFSAAAGDEDRSYRNALLRIYTDSAVDANLGKRAAPMTYDEAKKATDNFYKLRAAASFFSPAALGFNSPYQVQIDAYRQLRELEVSGQLFDAQGNPSNADQEFLTRYGEEYFPLTQALSRSLDGIPPTLEGHTARAKYRDLIERHPDLGGLIVGKDGAGEFNGAVFDSQFQSKVAPGSPDYQRQSLSFDELREAPNVRLGWMEFTRVMHLIEAERIQRGLPNLQVKAAGDLAALKRGFIEALATKYPEWYQELASTDQLAMTRRLVGMREIASDSRLSKRDDIAGLTEYLRIRDAVVIELRARKAAGRASTLAAGENQDLARLWQTLVGKIIEGPNGLAFGALHSRWLDRDLPSAEDAVGEEPVRGVVTS